MDAWLEAVKMMLIPVGILLILAILYFLVIRPMVNLFAGRSPGNKQAGKQSDPLMKQPTDDEDFILPPRRTSDMDRIAKLAKSDPDRASELIKQWLHDQE